MSSLHCLPAAALRDARLEMPLDKQSSPNRRRLPRRSDHAGRYPRESAGALEGADTMPRGVQPLAQDVEHLEELTRELKQQLATCEVPALASHATCGVAARCALHAARCVLCAAD